MLKVFFAILLLPLSVCQADEPQPTKFYKLNFVMKEVDANTVINTRSYFATTAVDGLPCSIRNSSHVPVVVSSPKGSDKIPYATTQYQNIELATNIDISNVHETGNGLSLKIVASIISIPEEPTQGGMPVTRSTNWSSTVLIPVGKPTTVFSSDDLTTKRKTQLEVTATPVK